jgi:hypothetical protein
MLFLKPMRFTIQITGTMNGLPITRTGRLHAIYENDICCVEGLDGLSPDLFFAKKPFLYTQIISELLQAWSVGLEVPAGFTPTRRIPDEILQKLPTLGELALEKVISALRASGYLPKIYPLRRGTEPQDVSWMDVASRCIL